MAYEQAIQALADPTRRAIFERLRSGPQHVERLAGGLHVTRPAVSQHLKVLAGAGLVRAEREGTRRIYRVEVHGLRELRAYLDSFWDDVLGAFQLEAESAAPRKRSSRATKPAPHGRPAARSRRKHGKR
jgi:DNA-binding transcriptional ArsR family regulator